MASYSATGVFKRSSGKPSRTSSCARTLRRKTGSATIVVVWSYADVSGRTTRGSSQFTVRRT